MNGGDCAIPSSKKADWVRDEEDWAIGLMILRGKCTFAKNGALATALKIAVGTNVPCT